MRQSPATLRLRQHQQSLKQQLARWRYWLRANMIEVGADQSVSVHQVIHDAAATDAPTEAVARHSTYYLDLIAFRGWGLAVHRGSAAASAERAWRTLPGDSKQIVEFAMALQVFYTLRGLAAEHLVLSNRALGYAQAHNDDVTSAVLLNCIGAVYDALWEKQKAIEYYDGALSLYQQLGDKDGEARATNNIGVVHWALGQSQVALEHLNRALLLRRQIGDISGEATTLNNIGVIYDRFGMKQTALEYYNQVLRQFARSAPLTLQLQPSPTLAISTMRFISGRRHLDATAKQWIYSARSETNPARPELSTISGLSTTSWVGNGSHWNITILLCHCIARSGT